MAHLWLCTNCGLSVFDTPQIVSDAAETHMCDLDDEKLKIKLTKCSKLIETLLCNLTEDSESREEHEQSFKNVEVPPIDPLPPTPPTPPRSPTPPIDPLPSTLPTPPSPKTDEVSKNHAE